MPTLQTGDRTYKVSFSDVFKSSKTLREEQLAYAALRRERAAKKAAAEKAAAEKAATEKEAAEKAAAEKAAAEKLAEKAAAEKAAATPVPTMPVFIPLVAQTSIPATPPAQQAEPPKASSESGAPHPCGNPERPISSQTDYKAASRGAFVWTPEHDARLTELKDVNTPWISISIAMDRPVHELKKRWHLLRAADVEIERRTAAARKARVEHDRRNPKAEDLEHRTAERTVEEEKPKRRVSFSDPLIIPGKQTDKPPEPPKQKEKEKDVKKVYYYLDNEFTLDEIILLHNLADRYEKEKWLRISSRFYDKTGKRITPEQAKSRIQRD